MPHHFFAADLGATSGRTILGTVSQGQVQLTELTRFSHPLIQTGGHYYWDILHLYNEILRGLGEVARQGLTIQSIGIDTWGVDCALFGQDGGLLRAPRSYRDPATFAAMDDYLTHVRSRRQLYDVAGTEIINFNTLFQLHAMRREGDSALAAAHTILFMPDALAYLLTGQRVCEYTIASTSGFLNARTRELDTDLLSTVGLQRKQFGRIVMPGTPIGTLTPEVQALTGLGPVPVVAVAGHDTQAAIAAIPASDENFAYLSSGTWSLMGICAPAPIIDDRSFNLNFTNEGGVGGTTCFLKNICGMWLLESLRREKAADSRWNDYATLIAEAQAAPAFRSLIYPDAPCFAAPQSMEQAIQDFCRRTEQPVPATCGELVRCIFDSLALRYRQVFHHLKEFAPHPLHRLHIIGGGSRNAFLNQLTADMLGVPVVAGPSECTALGNVMIQATEGHTGPFPFTENQGETAQIYQPHATEGGDAAYTRYMQICE